MSFTKQLFLDINNFQGKLRGSDLVLDHVGKFYYVYNIKF